MSIIFCENYEQCFKGYKAVAPSIYADDADVLDKLCTCIDFSWKEDAASCIDMVWPFVVGWAGSIPVN